MIRLLAAHRGVAALLAALVLSVSLLVAALPRMLEASYDEGAQRLLSNSPPQLTSLGVVLSTSYYAEPLGGIEQIVAKDDDWRTELPPALRQVTNAEKLISVEIEQQRILNRRNEHLTLAWVSSAESAVRYVKGRPPGPRKGNRFDVGLAAPAAAEVGIKVGDVLQLDGFSAKVTGLYEPVTGAKAFWAHYDSLGRVIRALPVGAMEEQMYLAGLTDGDSVATMNTKRTYQWFMTVKSGAVTARNAEAVRSGVADFRYRVSDSGSGISLSTNLDRLMTQFLDRLALTRTLIAVLLGGLIVVCAGTIALAVRLLAERVRGDLALMRARGASLRQVTLMGTGAAALMAVPAALVGYLASFAVPGPVTPIVHIGPALLALAAVGFCAAWVAGAHRKPLDQRRDDIVAARPSPRRIAMEVLVVALGVGGVQLLRTRGLGTDDPLLSLAPLLLALAAAVVTLRVYPLPLRLLVRLTARGRNASSYLGLTMAARAAAGVALPVLALLPALSIGAYGSATVQGIDTAQRQAAWQMIGAEIRVEVDRDIPTRLVEELRRTPGIDAVVPASVGPITADVGFRGLPATVVAVDLEAYRRLVSGSPLTLPRAPDSGALITRGLSAMSSFDISWPKQMSVVPKGIVTSFPGVDVAGQDLIVVPAVAGKANTLLISGDAEAVRSAVKAGMPSGAVIRTVDGALDGIAGEPLASALVTGLWVVTLALAVYALIGVAIAFVSRAPERARAHALLAVLGLTGRQARVLTLLEVTPLLLLTTCAGVALGIGLPALLGAGVDLAAYAGLPAGTPSLAPRTPALLFAAGVALIALVGSYLGGGHAKSGRS
ncbi:membrane protein [Planotetraspora silvatica]|uniref:Membrane protein n=1 Tax=Planotetraspora silvatica TaxID=234614 RepID=A0A8J3UF81_9ACTN|nr:FtsX-like permease family protein [Planotetraspora silvatica]GII44168.1 membrane protein [Planotetraspora silvatica]